MTENLLTWSIKNWITVFLMWLLGWAVLSLVGRVVSGATKPLPPSANTGAGALV